MKRLLRCEEWSKLRMGDGLDLGSLEELKSILFAWKQSTGEEPDGYFDISPEALVPKFWTGTLETATLVLEVVPIGANLLDVEKRSRLDNSLSTMLASAMSSQSTTARQTLLSTDGARHEALLEIFCENLQLARRRQVIRRYASISGSLPSPRGRISFPEQCYESIRRPGRFASTWLELSEDVPENRIFKEVLLRYRPRCSARIRGRVDLCLSELNSVDATRDHRLEWAKVRSDRLPPIYHSLLQQSRALLNDEGVGVFAGDRLATAEIIFTSRLFEYFVAKEISWISSASNLISRTQDRGTFACTHDDGKGVFELIPDIRLIGRDGKTALIIDTKWKSLDMQKRNLGISRDDVYQILTYGSRFSCNNLVLLYPDVTEKTGDIGYYQKFESILSGQNYSIHIVAIPMLAPSLTVVSNFLDKLLVGELSQGSVVGVRHASVLVH
ncbi:5-methylcytosine-specific restriction enzyme subunit McrC [Pseudomonas aeruginosa]|uniref:McrC family protein n=1 Tax=Pseudomonas aeruginosa TaxID=287 RepID=UPI000DEF8617|nr:hypothetical protein [Pseudomonas aeruginosa]RCM97458.1 5-methylcytosine-specific restriction enzyme subunit McrC [Pseudomonas aeruginosa]